MRKDWNVRNFIEDSILQIKKQVGDKKALCALSGGVDSSVAATMVHKAIGKNLICVFVDHGLLRAFEKEGFIYHSRVTIWKNPVTEMQRTKSLCLLHKQVKKDSTMSRVGLPDYVLTFRKDGERNNPVKNTEMSVDLWQKYASPVWMDIDQSNTLQGFRNGRDENDEKHICPLQLDTIERLIHLYTNKGDTVLTPFMGIGSEVYQSVKMDRKGIGFELKESYFDLAKKNLKCLLETKKQVSLF